MITIKDIAWAAGIYEGEGTFSGGHNVRVVQKDSWLIYELHKLFGGTISQYNGYHYWSLSGEKCRGFLLTIFTFLSPRRRDQILKYPLFFKDENFLPPQFCPNGHEYTEENTYIEKRHDRKWRICKICRKAHYDRKNAVRSLARSNETYEEKVIRIIAEAKKISKEEAKAIFNKTSGIQ